MGCSALPCYCCAGTLLSGLNSRIRIWSTTISQCYIPQSDLASLSLPCRCTIPVGWWLQYWSPNLQRKMIFWPFHWSGLLWPVGQLTLVFMGRLVLSPWVVVWRKQFWRRCSSSGQDKVSEVSYDRLRKRYLPHYKSVSFGNGHW